MSRYYSCYDKDGEPVSILPPTPEASVEFTVAMPPDDHGLPLDDAELLYDNLRWKGKTHAQARAAVRERFGV